VTDILVDHNIEGQAALLWSALQTEGWLDLAPMRLVRLSELGLPFTTGDRDVWRFAQEHRMLLLTANRNRKGGDSLEQTIRDTNEATSLPVITISDVERMVEAAHRIGAPPASRKLLSTWTRI
jgi:hypothetical protein